MRFRDEFGSLLDFPLAMARTAQDPLAGDVHRPIDFTSVAKGWNNLEEECEYWVPPSDVIGEIPSDLCGTLLRNGPGLNEIYGKKIIHPIDGDGMVVAVTFVNGRVHLRTKFVRTAHRKEEEKAHKYLYHGEMGTHPNGALKDSLTLLVNALQLKWPQLMYRNPSNTNVFYWGGKVISCYETGLPYCLDPYTLNTIGPDDFGGNIQLGCCAAHFRLDTKKDALVWMSVRPGVERPPALALYEFGPKWELLSFQMHHIEGLNYSHDFLLLPDYYILHMTPFAEISKLGVLAVALGLSAPGKQLRYRSHLPSRFVVIPRHSRARHQDVIFIDTDPFHIFHFSTAEQHGDEITFCAVCLDTKFEMTFARDIWLGNTDVAPGKMHRFKLDLDKRTCEGRISDRASVEFPTIHPYRHGLMGGRYSYLMASDREGQNLPYRDVVKFDAQGQSRQVWYSHGCIGEAVFVPRQGRNADTKGEEDDGYVITQLYVPDKHVTEFVVLNAKDLEKGPIVRVCLKHHIPYGFHGNFTPEVFLAGAFLTSKL